MSIKGTKMKKRFLCLIAVLTMGFVTCKKEVSVTGVQLDETTLELAIGGTETLRATVLPDNATNKTVIWTSSDEHVATVENGKVIAKAEGITTITATTQNGNKVATCEVTVTDTVEVERTKTLHDFVVDDIHGNAFNFSQLKGKKVLIVNVASYCGYTPHYAQLQELYEKYADNNFVVIGFPCNDFGGQEPGSHEQIINFCTSNYGVTFPLMSKVTVKGAAKVPIYKWLTEKSENGVMNAEIQWNFQKFMINESGQIVDCILTQSPFYDKVSAWIEGN